MSVEGRDAFPDETRGICEVEGVEAVDHLHRDEVSPFDATELVDTDDIRMAERDRDLRFTDEALDEVGVARVLRKDLLDDDVLLEPIGTVQFCSKHLGHAA